MHQTIQSSGYPELSGPAQFKCGAIQKVFGAALNWLAPILNCLVFTNSGRVLP
jgi:hypothetical protein